MRSEFFLVALMASGLVGVEESLRSLTARLKRVRTRLDDVIDIMEQMAKKSKRSEATSPTTSTIAPKTRPPDMCPMGERCPRFPLCFEEEKESARRFLLVNPRFVSKQHAACGKVYDLHTGMKSYDEAHKYCCLLNMTLVSVDSAQELQCLKAVHQLEAKPPVLVWTAGRLDKACAAGYSWCSRTASSNVGQAVPWAGGAPDPAKGSCVAVDFSNLDRIVLANEKCLKELRYFCESDVL